MQKFAAMLCIALTYDISKKNPREWMRDLARSFHGIYFKFKLTYFKIGDFFNFVMQRNNLLEIYI